MSGWSRDKIHIKLIVFLYENSILDRLSCCLEWILGQRIRQLLLQSCDITFFSPICCHPLPTFPPPTSLFRTLLEQVDHWQSFLALVNMIMFCTGIPGHYPVNETVSSLTLTFWYTLQVRKWIRAFTPIGSWRVIKWMNYLCPGWHLELKRRLDNKHK